MGLNAQTTVPTFTTGQVLTAAQQNNINTGIPVFADSTARDAAFGGTGEKVLAQGQYAFLESTNATQVYDGSTWQPVGASGLTLISATTVGSAVATVTVSGAFSSTYDNYKIVYSGGASSSSAPDMYMIFGSTVTGYYQVRSGWRYANSAFNFADKNNGVDFVCGGGTNNQGNITLEVLQPNLAKYTYFNGIFVNQSGGSTITGYQGSTTQFTEFTFSPDSGTLTGGTVYVYGYAKA